MGVSHSEYLKNGTVLNKHPATVGGVDELGGRSLDVLKWMGVAVVVYPRQDARSVYARQRVYAAPLPYEPSAREKPQRPSFIGDGDPVGPGCRPLSA